MNQPLREKLLKHQSVISKWVDPLPNLNPTKSHHPPKKIPSIVLSEVTKKSTFGKNSAR